MVLAYSQIKFIKGIRQPDQFILIQILRALSDEDKTLLLSVLTNYVHGLNTRKHYILDESWNSTMFKSKIRPSISLDDAYGILRGIDKESAEQLIERLSSK